MLIIQNIKHDNKPDLYNAVKIYELADFRSCLYLLSP
jgi:hypothetical protein